MDVADRLILAMQEEIDLNYELAKYLRAQKKENKLNLADSLYLDRVIERQGMLRRILARVETGVTFSLGVTDGKVSIKQDD